MYYFCVILGEKNETLLLLLNSVLNVYIANLRYSEHNFTLK